MRNRIFINPLLNREQATDKKTSLIQAHFERLSLICFGGGILGFLLGLVLLFIFDAADKTTTALKYRGLAVIVTAFFMLGCGAHFMDKADDEKRQIKKLRIEQPDRKLI